MFGYFGSFVVFWHSFAVWSGFVLFLRNHILALRRKTTKKHEFIAQSEMVTLGHYSQAHAKWILMLCDCEWSLAKMAETYEWANKREILLANQRMKEETEQKIKCRSFVFLALLLKFNSIIFQSNSKPRLDIDSSTIHTTHIDIKPHHTQL